MSDEMVPNIGFYPIARGGSIWTTNIKAFERAYSPGQSFYWEPAKV